MTRTIALSPIKTEVDNYLSWLDTQGLAIVSVVWPTLPGRDVLVKFAV